MGKVERYLAEALEKQGALHMALIDPARTDGKDAKKIASIAERIGSAAIMVGGSVGVSEAMVDEVVLSVKEVTNLPVILFPGSPTNLSKHADAVWFLSVLNSTNPYFIILGQMQGAPVVKQYGIEPLSLAYLIFGSGGTVGFVTQARLIPFDKPEIAVAYALAAEYLGFRYIYLEGGSGGEPIPPNIIRAIDINVNLPIITGGGIRTPELAKKAVEAGADIIVTGTLLEDSSDLERKLQDVIQAIKEAVKLKRR